MTMYSGSRISVRKRNQSITITYISRTPVRRSTREEEINLKITIIIRTDHVGDIIDNTKNLTKVRQMLLYRVKPSMR